MVLMIPTCVHSKDFVLGPNQAFFTINCPKQPNKNPFLPLNFLCTIPNTRVNFTTRQANYATYRTLQRQKCISNIVRWKGFQENVFNLGGG